MTRDEAIAIIASRLGNRGTALDATILIELKAAQTELEGKHTLPWFLTYLDTGLATVAETQTIAVPSTFLLEDEYTGMFGVNSSGDYKFITKKDYTALRASVFYDESAFPECYALIGTTVYFFPTPDVAYTINWGYYKSDTVLTTNIENSWLKYAPQVLFNLAGLRMARYLREPAFEALFKDDYNIALGTMWAQDEARRQAGLEVYMGG